MFSLLLKDLNFLLLLIIVPTIYLSGHPSSHPSSLAYFFQVVVRLLYVGHFKELLRFFWGLHAVSLDVLSDYRSFRSTYIEETLPRTDSLCFFIGGNMGIGTWKYTKAILNYFKLGSILKLKLNHCKQ